MVGGGNSEGYDHALLKAFGVDKNIADLPGKSAYCQLRKKISYKFFEQGFDDLIDRFEPHRETFRGLRIYAVDGQQLILPRAPDIVAAGFTGKAYGKYRESYMPRGYLTHAYDVLSGVTKNLQFGPSLNEVRDALDMIQGFEKASLTLYDRLYFHGALATAHSQAGNLYLARCKRNAAKAIEEFFSDPWRKKKTVIIDSNTVHLIKVWNPIEEIWDVFATNLPTNWLKKKLIQKLYRLRWRVETSFFELTAVTKAEQWHSKFVNGIFQELFCLFWLINYTKIQMHFRVKKPKNPLRDTYRRANFKLIFNFILMCFPKILKRVRGVLDGLATLIKKSTERRRHHTRCHPRELKSPASPYPRNNTLWQWEVK